LAKAHKEIKALSSQRTQSAQRSEGEDLITPRCSAQPVVVTGDKTKLDSHKDFR